MGFMMAGCVLTAGAALLAVCSRNAQHQRHLHTGGGGALEEEARSSSSTHRLAVCEGTILLQPRGSGLSRLRHRRILVKDGDRLARDAASSGPSPGQREESGQLGLESPTLHYGAKAKPEPSSPQRYRPLI